MMLLDRFGQQLVLHGEVPLHFTLIDLLGCGAASNSPLAGESMPDLLLLVVLLMNCAQTICFQIRH